MLEVGLKIETNFGINSLILRGDVDMMNTPVNSLIHQRAACGNRFCIIAGSHALPLTQCPFVGYGKIL